MWTEEMLTTLGALWAEGQTGQAIGDHIGKTRNAVLGKVAAMGLQRRNGSKSRKPKLKLKPLQRPPKAFIPPAPKPMPPKPKVIEPILIPTEKMELEPEIRKETWIPFMENPEGFCKWIVASNPTMCCGVKSVSGRPYCEEHVRIGHKPSEPPRSRQWPSHRRT
jgi:GcrA cell cycle regulator